MNIYIYIYIDIYIFHIFQFIIIKNIFIQINKISGAWQIQIQIQHD